MSDQTPTQSRSEVALFTYFDQAPALVSVVGRYEAPGAWEDEWLVLRDGKELAVRGEHLTHSRSRLKLRILLWWRTR